MAMAVIIVANVAITTQGIRGWVVSPPLPASISMSFDVDVVLIPLDVVVIISFDVVVCVVEERPAEEKRHAKIFTFCEGDMMSKQKLDL